MIKMTKPVLVLCVVNSFLFLFVVYFLLFADETQIPLLDNAEEKSIAESFVQRNTAIPAVDFSELLEKALFHHTRAKIEMARAPSPAERAEVKVVPSSSFSLQGVVFQENGESVAYLKNTNSNSDFGLKVNDEFQGWRVIEISRSSIIIQKGAEQSMLQLIKNE